MENKIEELYKKYFYIADIDRINKGDLIGGTITLKPLTEDEGIKTLNIFTKQSIKIIQDCSKLFIKSFSCPDLILYLDDSLKRTYSEDYINHLDNITEYLTNGTLTIKDQINIYIDKILEINKNFIFCFFDKDYLSYFLKSQSIDMQYFGSIYQLQLVILNHLIDRKTKDFYFTQCVIHLTKENNEILDYDMSLLLAKAWGVGMKMFCHIKNKNEIKNIFHNSLGLGDINTGTKVVLTMNVNRIIQDWSNSYKQKLLQNLFTDIASIACKILCQYNENYNNVKGDNKYIKSNNYKLTINLTGITESAKFLNVYVDHQDREYRLFISRMLQGIDVAIKNFNNINIELSSNELVDTILTLQDKIDKYEEYNSCYDSCLYDTEEVIDVINRFNYYNSFFTKYCTGGALMFNNTRTIFTETQYYKLLQDAFKIDCNLFTYNIPLLKCNKCGYINEGIVSNCKKCKGEELTMIIPLKKELQTLTKKDISYYNELKEKYYA